MRFLWQNRGAITVTGCTRSNTYQFKESKFCANNLFLIQNTTKSGVIFFSSTRNGSNVLGDDPRDVSDAPRDPAKTEVHGVTTPVAVYSINHSINCTGNEM
jgi:hypothetical protein